MTKKIEFEFQQLNSLYTDERLSASQIANKLGCSKPTVLKALKTNGILIRKNQGTSYTNYEVNDDFFKIWTEDMAYIQGYIAADGFINALGTALHLTSKDKEILDYCQLCMGNNCPIKLRESYDKRDSSKYIYTLNIPSKEIVKDLNALGLYTKKSLTIKFPKIPEAYLWHYLRGYTDGDGWIKSFIPKEGPRITLISSVDFIIELKALLELRLNTELSPPRAYGRALGLTIRSKPAYIMLDKMYNNDYYGLTRKKHRALQHVNYGKERNKL